MSGLFKHLISKVHACQEHGLLSHRLSPWRFVPPRERLIDPVGEAEVYLAYGRRQEALRVLRHAQREEPHNLEIKLLLLQTLAYLRDVNAYCELAGEMAPQLKGKAMWETICQEGQLLAPYEPLFMYHS